MSNLDNIFDRAIKAGKKIELKKTAKDIEMSQAEEAVKVATSEMEKAAIEGNESEYAQAKGKRNAAENRLEILRIRERNHVESINLFEECTPILKDLEKESVEEIRKMCQEFLSKYDELCCLIDTIDQSTQRYGKVQEYYKSYVLKSNEYHFKSMAEILPIACVLDFKRKLGFQRNQIAQAIGK